jgi:hypothetical protein
MHTLINIPKTYQQYIDLLKYSLEWMHARSLKQVLPNTPLSYNDMYLGDSSQIIPQPLLFLGGMRRFIRNRLVTMSDKVQHLFWSFAQVKRCADVVDESFIVKSLYKHRAAMDKRSEGIDPIFKSQIAEKFVQIIKGLKLESYSQVHEYSTSACFEASSASGGGKLHLINDFVQKGYTSNDELLKMSFHPRSGVSERRGFLTMDLKVMIEECPLDICRAVVYPICEPLKVRNITKGNALPYAIAKGFQLDLHSHMRKMYQFDLIGRVLDITDIQELVRRSPDGIFASGDFSAATDNVKIELTKLFFELCLAYLEFNCDVSAEYIHILQNVLYEHMISYRPAKIGGECPLPVLQRNGQLMGSVLSFPVLCAINLAVYWISVEPDVIDIKDLNVKINGDDILFRTDQEKYETWLRNVPRAGLTPSPGKNFFHPKYCTVNSEMFSVHGTTVREIPFYNVGMLLGQSKVARSGDKSKPVHCIHADAINGAFHPCRANARFLHYNAKRLKDSSTTPDGAALNYYLPRELGGLGMRVPNMTYLTSKSYKRAVRSGVLKTLEPFTIVNGCQRKIARHLLDRWTVPYLKRPCKPIGFEVDTGREGNNFQDIPNDDYHVLLDKWCPRLSYMRDKILPYSPINWKVNPMSSEDYTLLKFGFSGIRRFRGAKATVSNSEFRDRAFTEYRVAGG